MCPKSPGEGCVTVACAMQVDFGRLLGDLRLLVERLGKLAAHFRQAEGDLAPLGASSAYTGDRSARIEIMEIDEAEPEVRPTSCGSRGACTSRIGSPPLRRTGLFHMRKAALPGPRKAAR